ncbi:acetamidase/formamidase family protein [Baekduia soli]|uniref:Acetamidase/formamidase family protein n=1 Tax=Baekduia soli TaxID=496014 RepID=A0A5B8U605_9ACTN|nr:acetamidase/formamidase family protein [Baekduia soli]QEC48417.1 acetamidase/formamidase family protein [Baekduia soli]
MSPRIALDRDSSILAGPGPGHNRLHPEVPPVAAIDPGDELVVDCRDGMDGALRRAAPDLAGLELDANHPLTGPVAVRGAQPGDVLVVELRALECDPVGSTAVIPGFGLLGDRFTEPFLVRWDIAGGVARSEQLPGVAIHGRPFLGCVAVAPSPELLVRATAREAALGATGAVVLGPDPHGAVPAGGAVARDGLRTIPPRENGGNLDIRHLTVGSRLLLPVGVPEAMLSLGDPHFAQGDGESCGTAIEVAGVATVAVQLRAAADLRFRPTMPAYEYVEEPATGPRTWFATTGIPVAADGSNRDLDLHLAARNAVGDLVDWLVAERGLTAEQAYVVFSVAGDLRVSEIVNVPNALVSAALPLDVFEG